MTRTPTDDGDPVLKDGETLVVPMSMMSDSAPAHGDKPAARQITADDGQPCLHRPGFATLADADKVARIAAYDGYEKRMVDAYKELPPIVADTKPAPAATKLADNCEQAYDAYSKRLADAWRAA